MADVCTEFVIFELKVRCLYTRCLDLVAKKKNLFNKGLQYFVNKVALFLLILTDLALIQ
jgi:hypothetical protein